MEEHSDHQSKPVAEACSAYVRLPDHLYDPNISRGVARRHSRQYGVPSRAIYDRFHAEDRNMVFRRTPKPQLKHFSARHLAMSNKEIAEELGVTLVQANWVRAHYRRKISEQAAAAKERSEKSSEQAADEASSTSDDEQAYPAHQKSATAAEADHSTPRQPFTWQLPTPAPSALSRVVRSAATNSARPIWGLALLADVQTRQREASRACATAAPGTYGPLYDRFAPLPLSVLQRCITDLEVARARWHDEVLCPAREAAEEALVELSQLQLNTLAFNVCLWQRRHPLEVVTTGLSLYRTQPGLFQRGRHAPVQVLHELLESVTAAMEPQLARVHPVLRCDVFMTHPHLPLEEQLAVMDAAQAAWTASTRASCPVEVSKDPLCPRVLLGGYLAVEKIPSAESRFSDLLTDGQYAELREAFEVHKRDGMLRLLRQQYTLGQL